MPTSSIQRKAASREPLDPVTIDPLLTEPTTLTGEDTYDRFGHSVAMAGDVNGDGYTDVVVGAEGYVVSTGRVYVFTGGPTGVPSGQAATTAATTLTGDGFSSEAAPQTAEPSRGWPRMFSVEAGSSDPAITPPWPPGV